jgi:hypothetical protein
VQTTPLHHPVQTAAPPPLPTHSSHCHTHRRPLPRVAIKGACRADGFFLSPRSRTLLLIHASAPLLLTSCRHRPPPPITRAPPMRSTSPSLGRPSTNNFLREKTPRTEATTAFCRPPSASHRQASPVVLLLLRHHTNDCPCPGHHLKPCAIDHRHRTLPLTAIPLKPSHAPVETTPPVSPPPRCASSRSPTSPCSPSTPPCYTTSPTATKIRPATTTVAMEQQLPCL